MGLALIRKQGKLLEHVLNQPGFVIETFPSAKLFLAMAVFLFLLAIIPKNIFAKKAFYFESCFRHLLDKSAVFLGISQKEYQEVQKV